MTRTVFSGGRVFDGTGRDPAQADVAIEDGRIVDVGSGLDGDVAVDVNRDCWVLLDAPIFGADFRDVAPIIIRRTRDAGYEVQMGGLPVESNFKLIPTPDVSTWVSVKVV